MTGGGNTEGATIGGGKGNTVSGAHSTIGGGNGNSVSGNGNSTIGGGLANKILFSSGGVTIGGGTVNTARCAVCTIGGGSENNASGLASTIGGGSSNLASGSRGTVPGGHSNHATGDFSFAAGRRAKADHDGTFVWADQTGLQTFFTSTAQNQFLIRATGGVGIGTTNPQQQLHVNGFALATGHLNASSRRWKEGIAAIEGALDKVLHLRGVSFDWKADGKHDIGLIAEEVGEVIPEVVVYEANGEDAQSVDYARLVAVLIEAMKEQQDEIDELKAVVRSLVAEKE